MQIKLQYSMHFDEISVKSKENEVAVHIYIYIVQCTSIQSFQEFSRQIRYKSSYSIQFHETFRLIKCKLSCMHHNVRIRRIFSVKSTACGKNLPIIYSVKTFLLRKTNTSNSLQAFCRNRI